MSSKTEIVNAGDYLEDTHIAVRALVTLSEISTEVILSGMDGKTASALAKQVMRGFRRLENRRKGLEEWQQKEMNLLLTNVKELPLEIQEKLAKLFEERPDGPYSGIDALMITGRSAINGRNRRFSDLLADFKRIGAVIRSGTEQGRPYNFTQENFIRFCQKLGPLNENRSAGRKRMLVKQKSQLSEQPSIMDCSTKNNETHSEDNPLKFTEDEILIIGDALWALYWAYRAKQGEFKEEFDFIPEYESFKNVNDIIGDDVNVLMTSLTEVVFEEIIKKAEHIINNKAELYAQNDERVPTLLAPFLSFKNVGDLRKSMSRILNEYKERKGRVSC